MRRPIINFSKAFCLSCAFIVSAAFAQTDLDETVGQLVFNNLPSAGVIEKLSDLSGKIVINAQGVPQPNLSFDSNGPMTRGEAIRALESLLELNGITVIPLGDKLVKVVPNAAAQGQAPELLDGESIRNANDSQKTYAHIFDLDYITRQEGITIASNFLTPSGNINELPNVNAFYIQDSLSALKRIQTILEKTDTPAKLSQTVHFIQTENIAAEIAVRQLQSLQQGPLNNVLGDSTSFVANERGSQVIVVTHPDNMVLINSIIDQLNVEVQPITQSKIFNINHALAGDLSSILNSLISEQLGKKDNTEAGTVAENPNNNGGNQRNNNANANTNTPTPDTGTGKTREGFSEFISILPDERSNSIIAFGTESDLKIIGKLIDDIDVELELVKIDVIITEVTLTDEDARGIDSFNVTLNPNGILTSTGEYDFGITSASSTGLAAPLDVQGSIRDFSLALVFDTAQQKANVRVLQAPTITVSHNEEGQITVGERRPIVTSSTSDITNVNNVRSQVSYEDIGITLTVEPLIGKNGNIQLKVEQEISSVIGSVEIDGNQQPIIGNRLARSTLSVTDQEVIILGGLQESNDTKSRGRMAVFGRIPLLGPLFGGKTTETSRREIIIFLKPTILNKVTRQQQIERVIDGSSLSAPIKNYIQTERFGDLEPLEVPE
jgi:general secretion pathway protein D